MSFEHPTPRRKISTVRAVRYHLVVVVVCLLLGAVVGWLYAGSVEPSYTSTSRVLVNPAVGNAYAPTPASVRQDELTSLETEAQVAQSQEVLGTVADQGSLTTAALQRGLQVVVPANTQILEISYTSTDPVVAQQVANAVADAYLGNRDRRFIEVNAARITRVETQTLSIVTDLRAATAAAQQGSAAERFFQSKLSDALRNELVSIRAQRTALENTDAPPGAVIAPASSSESAGRVTSLLMLAGGTLAGLALGCLLAMLLERSTGVVRSEAEVAAAGLPVIAAVPRPQGRARLLRRSSAESFDTTIRRLRGSLLGMEPRPQVIAITPAGKGRSDAAVSEAVAQSFARAGHRVVLVRADAPAATTGLGAEEGLAQVLMHERLNVLNLLKPSVEPLLCLLPDGGLTEQSREHLIADRLRDVFSPLVDAGHLVVVQSPGIDSPEGEAVVAAADLSLVVVTAGRTHPAQVEQVIQAAGTRDVPLAALVVGRRDSSRRARAAARIDSGSSQEAVVTRDDLARARP